MALRGRLPTGREETDDLALVMSGSFVHKSIVASCGRSIDILASGPRRGRHYATHHYQPQIVTTRRLTILGLVALSALGIFLATHEENPAQLQPDLTDPPTRTVHTNPTTQSRIVYRLQDLRIREEAYRSRSPEYLRSIYSSDCPCLVNDERAIIELLDHKHRWRGISTAIEVRSVTRINDQLWIVVALLRSKALRIEKEDGRLIRIEPAGSDLFEFTLVKPRRTEQWLLGLVSDVEVRR
jgi:hypothetical protein